MISNLSPQSQQFLAAVDSAQQRIAVANQQLSSGLKIQTASDGPDVVSELLQLRANLQKNSQITNNIGLAKTTPIPSPGGVTFSAAMPIPRLRISSIFPRQTPWISLQRPLPPG